MKNEKRKKKKNVNPTNKRKKRKHIGSSKKHHCDQKSLNGTLEAKKNVKI